MVRSVEAPSLLSLIRLVSRCATIAFWRALTYPFRTQRAATFFKDVGFAALRNALHTITIPQTRWMQPTTTQQYLSFCKDHALEPHSVDIGVPKDAGTEVDHQILGHWIGDEKADVVVLYLHGGGYTQTATRGYFEFWNRVVTENDAAGKQKSIATLLLAYSMAPEERYPTQLQEATSALNYLLKNGRSPSSILLSGDSAGGGLTLSLCSHLLHPHPRVPEIKMSAPLAGMLVVSPWVSFSTEQDSFKRNGQRDMLEVFMLRRWAAMYLNKSKEDPEADPGPIEGDSYSEPFRNDATWWQGMHRVLSDVFIWFGGHEMLRDSIHDFVLVFREGWIAGRGDIDRVTSTESPGCAHIEPIMSVMTRPKERGDHQVVVEEWIRKRLEI